MRRLIVNGLTRGTLGLNIDLNYGEETLKALFVRISQPINGLTYALLFSYGNSCGNYYF